MFVRFFIFKLDEKHIAYLTVLIRFSGNSVSDLVFGPHCGVEQRHYGDDGTHRR